MILVNITPSLFQFKTRLRRKKTFAWPRGPVVLLQEFLELLRRAKAAGALKEAGGGFRMAVFLVFGREVSG